MLNVLFFQDIYLILASKKQKYSANWFHLKNEFELVS